MDTAESRLIQAVEAARSWGAASGHRRQDHPPPRIPMSRNTDVAISRHIMGGLASIDRADGLRAASICSRQGRMTRHSRIGVSRRLGKRVAPLLPRGTQVVCLFRPEPPKDIARGPPPCSSRRVECDLSQRSDRCSATGQPWVDKGKSHDHDDPEAIPEDLNGFYMSTMSRYPRDSEGRLEVVGELEVLFCASARGNRPGTEFRT